MCGRPMVVALLAVVVLPVLQVGCGDDLEPVEVVPRCAPPPGDLPTDGPLLDPFAFGLPASCVEGGLEELPGRWFVRADPRNVNEGFTFGYPHYEGSCDAGFTQRGFEVDHDDSDNATAHQWSDGTIHYQRFLFRFTFAEGTYEYARATATCVLADHTLAVVHGRFESDVGERLVHQTGRRFTSKDTGAKGLTLVGQSEPFFGLNLAIDGDYAYVAGDALRVFDISDPSAPRQLTDVPGRYNDVKLVRSSGKLVAYAAPLDGNEKVLVVDVTTPASPIASSRLDSYAHSLFVAPPATLYLATSGVTVPVYDVALPTTPVRKGTVLVRNEGTGGIHDIHVADGRLYVMKTTEGLVAVDLANGIDAPVEIGHAPSTFSHAGWEGTIGGRRIFIHGDEGMTEHGGAFLRVLDAQPGSTTPLLEIGSYQSRPEVGIHNMVIAGDRAYVAYYQDGVRVVDLSDPTKPREVGHYNTWDAETAASSSFDGAAGIVVDGDLVYIADITQGLIILRITP